MNIYKRKYGTVKEQLRIYGAASEYRTADPDVRYSAAYWRERYAQETRGGSKRCWKSLLTEYLRFECTEEERKFVDLKFFQCRKTLNVSLRMHICETTCYAWEKEILSDLTGLAMQAGLLSVEPAKDEASARADAARGRLTDGEWARVSAVLPDRRTGRPSRNKRNAVEAVRLVLAGGMSWRGLPAAYGPWKTAYNRYLEWRRTGLWEKIAACLDER